MRNTHVGRAALYIVVASLAPIFASCEKSGMNQSIEDLQPHQEWGDDSSSHFFDTTHHPCPTALVEFIPQSVVAFERTGNSTIPNIPIAKADALF